MRTARLFRDWCRPGRRRSIAAVALAGLLLASCGAGAGDEQAGDAARPAEGSSAPSVSDGEPVPATSTTSFEGETVSFADYEGVPLVVNFWASWCPPCIAEMPDFEEVHQAAGDQVAFVGVNTQDTAAEAEDLVAQTGVTYDLVRDPDGDLFREFGVFGMPSTFYVDADGQIVGRHTGLLTRDTLVEDLREHLGVEVQP